MLCTCVLSLRIVSAAGVCNRWKQHSALGLPKRPPDLGNTKKYKSSHTKEYTRVQIHSNPCGQNQVWEIQIANLVIDNSQKI